MKMTPVSSSMISRMGWADSVLEVEFRKGNRKVRYQQVPEEVYQEIMDAPSIGKAFISLVKEGGFKFEYTE